jgi:hypothetical protein
MSRRTTQLNRIEQAIARLEETVAEHAGALRGQAAAIRIEVRDAASSAEAAHAGVQALADIHATGQAVTPAAPATAPQAPAQRRRTAAGTFAPESGEAAERLHSPGDGDGPAGNPMHPRP